MEARSHIELVGQEVDEVLRSSHAFHRLSSAQQQKMRDDMRRIGIYLTDPTAHVGTSKSAQAKALADEQTATTGTAAKDEKKKPDAAELTKLRLAEKPGQVGAEFQGGAMQQGVEQFGNLVQKVDFPVFVSGLIKGVFQAVVDASIQQMQAYAELVGATAKSAEQFSQDHISDGQARDHLAQRYPSQFAIDTSGDGARLKSKDGGEVDLGGQSINVSDPERELALVNNAKLDMAKQRQQQMATMLLMGINRIVVTDGKINAKVVFDIQANDSSTRHAKAEMYDAQSASSTAAQGSAGLSSPWAASAQFSSSDQQHRTTVGSAIDDTSESKAQMKAQLSGDVHLAFKSETFPLEKMVDVLGMQTINDRATPPSSAGPRATTPGSTK